MALSKIEWTEVTWNPVTGCSKVSEGCRHCYAERMAKRLQAMGQTNYRNGFDVSCHAEMLERPLTWRKPKTVFVNSMSDLFHEDVPFEFIVKVFDVMREAHWHRFQVLTKRAERLEALSHKLDWPNNVWMGVSVENDQYTNRVDHLRRSDAEVKFLSLEPLIGPVPSINLDCIDWVIVGGESGPGARTMRSEWVREVLAACQSNDIPFFFKQWGGVRKKKAGRLLDGRSWDEMPKLHGEQPKTVAA